MAIGVCCPALRVTTKSALYWVGASARGSVVSSAGAVNAGRSETKANKPADISLFMIRLTMIRRLRLEPKTEFSERSQESGARSQEARNAKYEADCILE